jgi:hypothetical protein
MLWDDKKVDLERNKTTEAFLEWHNLKIEITLVNFYGVEWSFIYSNEARKVFFCTLLSVTTFTNQ